MNGPASTKLWTRREALRLSLAAGVLLPGCASNGFDPAPLQPFEPGVSLPWTNWAANQQCVPLARFAPRSEDELAQRIAHTPGVVRPVGAGHSFSALVPTEGTLISGDLLSGIVGIDRETDRAEVWAGTRLHELGPLLEAQGQALPNQPDIDYQALGGAIATSTHGTGAAFGSLSAYVTGLAIVTPSGLVVECSADKNAELFQAARCSLGALGFVTRFTLQNIPALRLREVTRADSTEDVLDDIERHVAENRHFEFHAFPHSRQSLVVRTNPAPDAEPAFPEEDPKAIYQLREIYGATHRVPGIGDWIYDMLLRQAADGAETERIGASFQVLAHPRIARFREMEYSVPAEAGPACLREILQTIRKRDIPVVFPIEYRYVHHDDIWLSMFEGRDTCTISIHNYADEDYRDYFHAVEPIFWKYEGRPHWGKLHSLDADALLALYPRMRDFRELREELDPKGRFLNPHLRHLLGA